jgi:hypothetical protein
MWSNHYGDVGAGPLEPKSASGVATDATGNIFIMGYFEGAMDFGGGPLVSDIWGDIFIAKVAP